MRILALAWVVGMALAVYWMIGFANGEQAKYEDCWEAGGVQVKTVKFSNGTVCIDRSAVIEP